MTPTGIETAIFRFVAQHLNHCATAVPQPSCKSRNVKPPGILMSSVWYFYKYDRNMLQTIEEKEQMRALSRLLCKDCILLIVITVRVYVLFGI